jgi:MFS family permease
MPLWLVGLIIFLASVFQLALDIPAGYLLDRFGYKKMLVVGTAVAIVGVAAFFYGISALSLVVSIFLVAVGWLLFSPGISAYSLSHADRHNSIKFMAYRDIFTSLGIVLSVASLPFIVNASGSTIAMYLSVILIFSLIAIFFAPRDKNIINEKTAPHQKTHHQRRFLISNVSKVIKRLTPASTLLLLLTAASGIFYGIVWFVIPLIISLQIYNGAILSAGLAMFDFSVILVGSFLSNMAKRSLKKMIWGGLLVFSISGFLLGINFGILFVVFAILSTTGNEMASLPLWVWLHELDTQHNKDGLMSGVVNLSGDFGWAVGPLLAGFSYQLFGPTFAITLGAIPIAGVLAVYYFIIKTKAINTPLFKAPTKPHFLRHKS